MMVQKSVNQKLRLFLFKKTNFGPKNKLLLANMQFYQTA